MKNILKSICLIFILSSCNEEQASTQFELTAEALASNENFGDLLRAQQQLTTKFATELASIPLIQHEEYLLALQDLSEIGTTESIEKKAQMMGFDSAKEYETINNDMLRAAEKMTQDFPTMRTDPKVEEIFILATEEFSFQAGNYRNSSRTAGGCAGEVANCYNKANATLALATAGCISSVFIPFAGPFIGVGCELAAIYNHHTDATKCNIDFEDCQAGE